MSREISSIDLHAMASLIQSMVTAARTLEESAASIRSTSERVLGPVGEAQKLTTTAGWVRDQIPGLRRRLALAQQIEAQVRGFQPTVQINEAQLSTVPPDIALAEGAAAAKKLKEAGGKPDAALVAEIAKYQNDPYFAAGFTQNISPSDLSQLVQDVSLHRIESYDTGLPKHLQDWEKSYAALLSAVGSTIATATRNTGELALPGDYATRWVSAITTEPRGMAASVVLRYGNYSTEFLNTVSAKVYDYERALSDRGMRDWLERGLPDANSSRTGPFLPDGRWANDPLANVLEALSHNPQAAQNFFDVANPHAAQAEGLTINGRPVNDRLKYLLQDRNWSDGSELGHALEAATTELRDHAANGRVSATIAAQTFALIGQRTAGKDDWKMPPGLRPGVAKMLASYMPDVFRMRGVHNAQADHEAGSWIIGTDDDKFPPGQPFGITLDPGQVEQIIATLGENKSDIEIVTAGVLATSQLRLAYGLKLSLANNPNTPGMLIKGESVPWLENASAEGAGALGWVVRTAYAGDLSEEEIAKKQREMLAKTLTTLTSLPIFSIGEGVGTWTKYAFEQLKDRAITEIGKAPEGTSERVYGDMDEESQKSLSDNTRNLMLQAGYLRPEYFAAANKEAGGLTYQAPPMTALKGHSGPNGQWVVDQPPAFDLSSDAYRSWSRGYGGNKWISENVYDPYNREWPHQP